MNGSAVQFSLPLGLKLLWECNRILPHHVIADVILPGFVANGKENTAKPIEVKVKQMLHLCLW